MQAVPPNKDLKLDRNNQTDNTVASASVMLEDEVMANPYDFNFEAPAVANYAYVN